MITEDHRIEAVSPAEVQLRDQSAFFHAAVTRWLSRPGITIACGRWSDDAISELVPQGQASLLPAIYDGCFVGVRELRLQGQPHDLRSHFGTTNP